MDSGRRLLGKKSPGKKKIVITVGVPAALVMGSGIMTANAATPNLAKGRAARDPSVIGRFSKPFQEGGATPRCRPMKGDHKKCKPTAVSSVVLKDGRVLYWNGIEGSENSKVFVSDSGEETEDSSSRLLNPMIDKGDNGSNDPDGMAGVPGRPGDGLVGSTLGKAHKVKSSSPPDDRTDNDGDMFCSYQILLDDGRVLSAGGTDWYNEPRLPEKVPGVGGWGVVELEATIFSGVTKLV